MYCLSSLPRTGHYLGEGLHLPAKPMFLSFLCSWASWLWVLPCHFIVLAIALPFLFYFLPMGLWVDALAVPAHFFINLLLMASLAHFPCLYIFWALLANILAMPVHFIPRVSSAHLLLLYIFYSHGLFSRSFGLPQPNYHIFTSYYFLGLLAFRLTH